MDSSPTGNREASRDPLCEETRAFKKQWSIFDQIGPAIKVSHRRFGYGTSGLDREQLATLSRLSKYRRTRALTPAERDQLDVGSWPADVLGTDVLESTESNPLQYPPNDERGTGTANTRRTALAL